MRTAGTAVAGFGIAAKPATRMNFVEDLNESPCDGDRITRERSRKGMDDREAKDG